MRIDFYEFGRITVEGKNYTHDLLIFPDRIISPWWRLEGHELGVKDLEIVWKEKISYLVIGTGAYGMMRVAEEVKKKTIELGINLIVEKTGKATQIYNHYEPTRQIAGAFHLTC